MKPLITISRTIDRLNEFIGHSVSWLLLVAVLVSAGNAVSRKLFSLSSNAMLELQWYLYGAVFMLAAAYALLKNEHIRIDILSSSWSKRTRDWIDLILHTIFLVPFAGMMIYLAWPWFWRSFESGEHSTNAGGLILWPAKSFILIGFILLLLQAFSEIIKRAAVISGHLKENDHLYSDAGNAAHMMTEDRPND
ncbi:TRAP transporter small permease subunit [Martelella lutilitoris]|uniref:TRAP transporter small permease protein n=1 Tax=Martelella lutilitoris TaxID=2583532 RepID=A0A7T7KM95_9HYPH|nr:TRAP transporter small permease subunit [Martelella lutilitoris]MAM12331.1 sugar transporter [Rhizobiaceae bacterium]QQM31592.1 TRAP transporter small permease subunit [Martelella lutilitoris]|tara:strand:+ start:399 stop:977 length:579 start_codon:yes stop_codon:yes gene_type:complete